jgi:HSP20 family protein
MMKKPKSTAKIVILENNDPISAEAEAIQSRIRQRAFELSQTRPDHPRDFYDWIAAESEVMSVPAVKLVEKNGVFEARFAIAGVHPEDLHVMVTPDQILIRGEYNETREADEGTVHFSDFRAVTVFRAIPLPQPIDTKSVKVEFEHGVLSVTATKLGAQIEAPARKAPAKARAKAAKA